MIDFVLNSDCGKVMIFRKTALIALLTTVAACGAENSPPPAGGETTAPSSPAPSTARSEEPEKQGFQSSVSKVKRSQVKYSWRENCPVGLGDLRLITMTYRGFDDKDHTGEMVVRASAAKDIVKVFRRLYNKKYPIRRMELVDAYKASDYESIDADNTSAFNCRRATGSSNWSQHAYGLAVDLNPRENPYVRADGGTAHDNARKFVDRPDSPGVIHNGDAVVKAFDSIGWGWGGTWSGTKDYQHFSSTGR